MKTRQNNKYRNNDKRSSRRSNYSSVGKIDRILIDVQKKIKESYNPISLDNLSAYERKRIHSFFDNKPDYQTKTYRDDNDNYILKVFPIGNLKNIAEKKAQHVLETGESFFWEDLGNYERFIVHDHLKSYEGIETISSGDGDERKLEIKQKQFGRSLKKIMKKIKIF